MRELAGSIIEERIDLGSIWQSTSTLPFRSLESYSPKPKTPRPPPHFATTRNMDLRSMHSKILDDDDDSVSVSFRLCTTEQNNTATTTTTLELLVSSQSKY